MIVEHDQFRRVGHCRRERMDAQRPEPPAERHHIVRRNILIAENQDLILQKRVMYCRKRRLVERLR